MPDERLLEQARRLRAIAGKDLATAELLALERGDLSAMAAYHCQQAAEKWLKALLAAHAVTYPKTHDIPRLLQLARELHPDLTVLAPAAAHLTMFSTEPRYVLLDVDPWHLIAALHYVRQMRDAVGPLLPPQVRAHE